MLSPWQWALLGFVIYWLAVIYADQNDLLPAYIGTQGPILTVKTRRGRDFLDWLAGPKRFWRAWANVGVGIALVVMIGSFLFLAVSAYVTLTIPQETSAVNNPKNFLVIPGVNDFLPLSAAPPIVFGLALALVVHEGGHGLLSRVEDIEIESMGLALLAVLPIGAFVEPNETQRREQTRGAQTRMFAAGVTNNFAVTIVVYALLFGPIIASISVAPGAAIAGAIPGSPAASADIGVGDRVTAIDGVDVDANGDLDAVLENSTAGTVTVEVNGDRTERVDRTVLVTESVQNGPADVDINDTVVAVNDTPVNTTTGFENAVRDSPGPVSATIENPDGETRTTEFVAGAYVLVLDGEPFARAGAPAGEGVVVTHVDGERVVDATDLISAIESAGQGTEIELSTYHDGARETYAVTLGAQNDEGFLGVQPTAGTTGLVATDFGVRLYPAENYLAMLDDSPARSAPGAGPVERFFGAMLGSLFLPLASIAQVSGLPFNFAGFEGPITNFYVAEGGPLSVLGDDAVFWLANLAFWSGWINVQLGFFNCIPAFPLDGGHILRTSTEAVLSRLPIDPKRRHVRVVTTSVGLAMLAALLAVMLGPTLL